MLKNIFLKSLKEGWRYKLSKMKDKPTKDQLVDGAMQMLSSLGDSLITREDIESIAEEVLKEE